MDLKKKNISILHIWGDYMPNLFDETHPYCLKQPNVKSTLVGAALVDNGAPVHPHSYFMSHQSTLVTASPTLLDRIVKKLREPFFWFRYNLYLKKIEKLSKPNLLHVHFGTTAAQVLPFLEKHSAPLLVTFYGIDASEALRVEKYQKAYTKLFKRADKIIILCEAVKERLVNAGCPSEKIYVWNMPAGIEKYPYFEKPQTTTTRFLICARFVEKKGYPYLFEAFKQLITAGKDVHLTMVGYGPMKEKYLNDIKNQGLEKHITVIDTNLSANFETIYRKHLQENDVFVLPSTTAANGDDEGGPALTLICAQASGLPVICTPFPGSELSVEDGVTGIYCKQDDTQSLTEKMLWMIENKDKWGALGKAASRFVQTHFSLSNQMQKQMAIYEEMA